MSDEEITYTSVRFGKSSELQTRGRHDETQGPRRTVHRECLAPWYLVAVSLGILCSLLVAVAVLVAYVSQYSGNKHELQKNLNNLIQQYQTLQKNNSLMKEMLRNKSKELDDLKLQKEHDSSNREQNRFCGETKVLDFIQFTGKYVDGYWLCCGIKCYFMMDNTHWSGCKRTCRDCSLSLLKIDNNDELRDSYTITWNLVLAPLSPEKFLQDKVNPNTYWIGLSYNATKSKKWQWIDEEPSNLTISGASNTSSSHSPNKDDLMTMKSLQENKGCASLSFGGIKPHDCGRNYPCICEKRKDKFPLSVCSVEKK